eukprot:Hpha_TRINITY_DN12595_c0_g1::TRINITY_DN12595_c0_g1_i1::g.50946::m.50946
MGSAHQPPGAVHVGLLLLGKGLEVFLEVVALNKVTRSHDRVVVPDQTRLFGSGVRETVVGAAGTGNEEVGGVLRHSDGVLTVVDGFTRLVAHLLPFVVVLLGVPLGPENGVVLGLNAGHKLNTLAVLVGRESRVETTQGRGIAEVLGVYTVVVVVHRHRLALQRVKDPLRCLPVQLALSSRRGEVESQGNVLSVDLVERESVFGRRLQQPLETHASTPQWHVVTLVLRRLDLVEHVLGRGREGTPPPREEEPVDAGEELVKLRGVCVVVNGHHAGPGALQVLDIGSSKIETVPPARALGRGAGLGEESNDRPVVLTTAQSQCHRGEQKAPHGFPCFFLAFYLLY